MSQIKKTLLILLFFSFFSISLINGQEPQLGGTATTKDCHHDYFTLGDVSIVDHRALRASGSNVYPDFTALNTSRTKPIRPIKITFDYQSLIKDYFSANATSAFSYLNLSNAVEKANALANKATFEGILQNLSSYFSNLIQIFPESTPIKFPSTSKCQDITNTTVNATWITTGNNFSDLVIFLKEDNLIVQHVGFSCIWLTKSGISPNFVYPAQPDRPIFGIIRIVKSLLLPDNIKTEKWSQKKGIEIYNSLLHQMFHILGLSKFDYSWWHLNEFSYYTAVTVQNTLDPLSLPASSVTYEVLSTPRIQRAAFIHYHQGDLFFEKENRIAWQDYIQNEDFPGVYLENNEQDSAAADIKLTSHFEATVAFGEIMTASGYFSVGYPSIVSIFTLSALEDTGYYASIQYQFAEILPFGSGIPEILSRLCYISDSDYNDNFFTFHTDSLNLQSPYYSGFAVAFDDAGCDFYGYGYGVASNFPATGRNYLDAECQVLLPQSDSDYCTNDQAVAEQKYLTFDRRNINSRCFLDNFQMSYDDNTPQVVSDYRCYNTFADHLDQFNFARRNPYFDPDTNDSLMNLRVQIGNLTFISQYLFDPLDTAFSQSYGFSLDNLDLDQYFAIFTTSMCPNLCSQKGICVRGKGCQCYPNNYGPDCSISNATRVLKCANITFPGGKGIWQASNDSCIDPNSCKPIYQTPRLDVNGEQILDASNKPIIDTFPSHKQKIGSTCIDCPYGCKFCLDDRKCLECENQFLLQEGSCVSRCDFPDFYYDSLALPPSWDQNGNLVPTYSCTRKPLFCTDCYNKGNPECASAFQYQYSLSLGTGGCLV